MKVKWIFCIMFLWLLMFSQSLFADRYIKLAAIDFAYVFKNYSATSKIRAKLEAIRKEVSATVERERRQITALEKLYLRNINANSELERRWQRSEIELRKAKLLDNIEYYKTRLKSIESKMSMPFITEIYMASKKIAEGRGFSLVMHNNRFVMADAQHDISHAVLQYLERKLRGELRE